MQIKKAEVIDPNERVNLSKNGKTIDVPLIDAKRYERHGWAKATVAKKAADAVKKVAKKATKKA